MVLPEFAEAGVNTDRWRDSGNRKPSRLTTSEAIS
jgi:hypothetical protein